ncbi:membrane protein [Edaphobacter acidisoli]|uniref:Membrane protein n=2 Tax=Edaphobacter acidisoli TaxID=2040573 RepID=A0A916S0H6_9BACT|nr:membrane protein [Edaphobacter acidisoli]
MAGSGGLSETAAAAISYITIIPAIIFLVIAPYNRMPLVRFHSFQSIALAVAWFVVWIAITILHVVLHFIPLIGILFVLVDLVVSIGFFVAWLVAIIRASRGEWFKLPVIGDIAQRMARGQGI